MPCQLSDWEVAQYEREDNKKKFGKELTDVRLLEEVACQATKFLKKAELMDSAPPLVRKWFKEHSKKDAEKKKGK